MCAWRSEALASNDWPVISLLRGLVWQDPPLFSTLDPPRPLCSAPSSPWGDSMLSSLESIGGAPTDLFTAFLYVYTLTLIASGYTLGE